MKNKFLKAFIICLLALFTTNSAKADFSFNDMELRFAQISDVHLCDLPDTSYKVLSSSKALLDSAIKNLNKIKGLDFVVFTGDMVNDPKKEYYKDFLTSLSELNHPSILTLGNHDALKEKQENNLLTKEEVINIFQKSNPYQNYGTPYFAFSPSDGYRVIVLDTTMGYEFGSNGYIDDVQLQFLDQELSQNQDKTIVIFQHHPVVEPFKSNDHKILNANAYLNILSKYPSTPIGIFAGHYHATKIIKKDNVVHVASPSLVTYPNAFRTVIITNYSDRVIFNFYFSETSLKNIQEKSKATLITTSVFNGTSSDRIGEIMIRKGFSKKAKKIYNDVKAQEKAYKKAEKEAKKATKRAQKEAEKELMEFQEQIEKR